MARKCDIASCATSYYDVIGAGMKAKTYFEVLWCENQAKATLLGCKMRDM